MTDNNGGNGTDWINQETGTALKSGQKIKRGVDIQRRPCGLGRPIEDPAAIRFFSERGKFKRVACRTRYTCSFLVLEINNW